MLNICIYKCKNQIIPFKEKREATKEIEESNTPHRTDPTDIRIIQARRYNSEYVLTVVCITLHAICSIRIHGAPAHAGSHLRHVICFICLLIWISVGAKRNNSGELLLVLATITKTRFIFSPDPIMVLILIYIYIC